MPPPQTKSRLDAIVEEQRHLEEADARRRQILTELAATLREPVRDRTEAARHTMLARRRRALAQADHGLVLGRIDTDDGTHRIGRVGIPAEDGEPLVLDWRADAARPFYTATALEPQGVRRRRHIRTDGLLVTGVDDEDLAGDGGSDDLVGEAALIAALDERRTGRMGDAVATLQREQDAVIRASADRPLVVQGGPGTGKTVVGLHRVAYLLFAEPEIARRGVLLVGPSRRFLDYVAQVLPALGETAVVAATCPTLLPGVDGAGAESRELAEVMGRACWWPALRRHVAGLVPAPRDLALVHDGERYLVRQPRVARVLASALTGGRSLLPARRIAFEALREALVDAVAERAAGLLASVEDGLEDVLGAVDAALARSDDRAVRTTASSAAVDGELDDADIEAIRTQVANDPGVTATLERWWPAPDAAGILTSLLRDREALSRAVPELTEREADLVAAEHDLMTPSGVALLDALTGLLGEPERQDAQGRDGDEPFLADRAAADPWWTYGHVVVDEAQELSAMQWHMIRRRCPTGSITAVGDIDQTDAPHRHTGWQELLEPVLGDRWRLAELSICYRTPREVMALVGPVLTAAGSTNEPPRAVRSTGREPRSLVEPLEALPGRARALADELLQRYPGGSVGVVTAAAHLPTLCGALGDRAPVMTPAQAKGLEYDACIVVDPDGITQAPRGWNALYVAMTRCTQELVLLRPH